MASQTVKSISMTQPRTWQPLTLSCSQKLGQLILRTGCSLSTPLLLSLLIRMGGQGKGFLLL